MSLPDELLNIPWKLDAFFGRIANIFIVLTKSLQVSFFDRCPDREWTLQEVAFFPDLIEHMISGRVEGSELILLMIVALMSLQWASSSFSSLPLSVKGFFCPLRHNI